MNRYTVQSCLTKTLYGDMLLCTIQDTNQQVVLKRISIQHARSKVAVKDKTPIFEDAFNERIVSQSFYNKHKNVLGLIDEFEHDDMMCLAFEYCSGGDLFVRTEQGNLSIDEMHRYFQQIVKGVRFMHDNGYAHRDLSLENVLISDSNQCVICDFGLATKTKIRTDESVGKLFYIAPEVYEGTMYLPEEADMWSLGIMLFILLTGIPLAEKPSADDCRFKFLTERGVRALLQAWELEDTVPPLALEILEGLLQPSTIQRMTMDELCEHPWINLTTKPSKNNEPTPMSINTCKRTKWQESVISCLKRLYSKSRRKAS